LKDEAILQQSGLARLKDATKHDLRSLRDWLTTPNMGNLALIGADRNTWGDDNSIDPHHDLLSLNTGPIEDPFSSWLNGSFLAWFHHIFWYRMKNPGADPETGIVTYSSESIRRTTSYITTVVASSLPIMAIVFLYCVNSMKARLGLITLFSFVFSACLNFFTDSKRGEIFLASST
jgi:hypothetical protein